MACRVGMSTQPQKRIEYWMKEEGHTDWEIVEENLTYDDAQFFENELATQLDCKQEDGGPRKSGHVWSVYHVSGGR